MWLNRKDKEVVMDDQKLRDQFVDAMLRYSEGAHDIVEGWLNGARDDTDSLRAALAYEYPEIIALGSDDDEFVSAVKEQIEPVRRMVHRAACRVNALRCLLEHLEYSHYQSVGGDEGCGVRRQLLQSQLDLWDIDKRRAAEEFRRSIGVSYYPPALDL